MRNAMHWVVGGLAIGLMLVGTPAARAAGWTEPKDGTFTEKQLTNYIDTMKEVMASWKAAGKALEGGQNGFAAAAVLARTDAKTKEVMAKHGLAEDEYTWLSGKAFEAWGGVIMQNVSEEADKQMTAQTKLTQDKIAVGKQKLAAYEKALKDGRRVLTPEERESIIKSAKDDQQSALDEAKQHADEAKQHANEAKAAGDEAAKADAEAKAAEAAGKNPPKDLSDDDKAAFIDEKKNAVETAKSATKDARDKQTEAKTAEADAKKAEAESRAKAALAAGRIKDPDLPVTAEEKAQAKLQNEEGIKSQKEEIVTSEQAIQILQESGQVNQKNMREAQAKTPAQNVALLKKHQKEFEDAWGIKK
ncbi:MAG: hypothetical protein JWL69_694 [Phycisphaerales bacterium]|nr:hypothetical protein [Phycisphaerales bacterium]